MYHVGPFDVSRLSAGHRVSFHVSARSWGILLPHDIYPCRLSRECAAYSFIFRVAKRFSTRRRARRAPPRRHGAASLDRTYDVAMLRFALSLRHGSPDCLPRSLCARLQVRDIALMSVALPGDPYVDAPLRRCTCCTCITRYLLHHRAFGQAASCFVSNIAEGEDKISATNRN